MAVQSVGRQDVASNYTSGKENVKKTVEVETVSVATPKVQEAPAVSVVYAARDKSPAEENREQIEKNNEKIKKAVSELNKKMANTECQFGVHEGTGRLTIKIVDKESKEVLREYPTEETLDMVSKMWEIAGIRVDKKL